MSSRPAPNASRLRTSCRATSRQGVLAAAPLELVDRDHVGEVEHVDLLQLRRGAELRRHHVQRHVDQLGRPPRRPGRCRGSPRSPGRSPAALHAAMMSGDAVGQLRCRPGWPASGRTRWSPSRAFIRIRSPSSAPPPRRRVGSTASTAMRSLSCWSMRNRRTSSSVSDDLPEPPVPVMPSTGTRPRRPPPCQRRQVGVGQPARLQAGDRPRQRAPLAGEHRLEPAGGGGQVDVAVADQLVDHAGQAEPLAVLRGEDRAPRAVQPLDLARAR